MGVVLMRIAASSAIYSIYYSIRSKWASISTAAAAVVRNAPVMIYAVRFYIFRIAAAISLPLPMRRLPGICYAEHP